MGHWGPATEEVFCSGGNLICSSPADDSIYLIDSGDDERAWPYLPNPSHSWSRALDGTTAWGVGMDVECWGGG